MPDETFAFDVFLSHNSKDKPAVRQIAEVLRDQRGLKVWLDEWELPPGVPWQDELETIIKTVRSAAVLVGKDGLGPWEMPEMRGCLVQMVDRKMRVIPVLLPGVPAKPQLPMFLAQNTWVDLRGGIDDEGLDRLQWGITGTKPSPRSAPSRLIPPRLHNLPFSSLGPLFQGRDEELRRLQDGPAMAITQAETISGLGGIGKTRLAVEHAWRSGNLYDSAFFVVAESPEALRSNLAGLARPELLNLPEQETVVQEQSVAAVLRWLREHDRWLLILDNVDTKEAEQAVTRLVPSLSAGRVLITSRIKDWPPTIPRQQIETLTLDEAQRFLLDRTARDRDPANDDESQARRLAEQLDGLPLALEQAAAYIARRQMKLSAYLEQWEKEREKVLNWYDGSVMQYPRPVAVTWQKTFEELHPTAAAILRLTAYLAPDPIPAKMFEVGEGFVREATDLLRTETGLQAEEISVDEAVTELSSFSMATRKGESVTVHRMVQEALRSTIPEKQRNNWIDLSLKTVDQFAPFRADDVRTWPIWNHLRPHTAQVIQYADEAGIVDPTSTLMGKLALLLLHKSLYIEAEPLMWRALQIGESTLGPQHPDVARRLNNLASLLRTTNRPAEAEPLMRRALQISEDILGPQHPDVAIRLNNLAQLLQDTNRLAEAEPLMRRALQISEDTLGPQHPSVAIRLSNLAQLLKATSRLAEAEPLMRHALQIDEDSFGPQHPNVARDLYNLAYLLRDTERLEEAIPLVERSIEIYERSFGTEHPKTQSAQSTLSAFRREITSRS